MQENDNDARPSQIRHLRLPWGGIDGAEDQIKRNLGLKPEHKRLGQVIVKKLRDGVQKEVHPRVGLGISKASMPAGALPEVNDSRIGMID